MHINHIGCLMIRHVTLGNELFCTLFFAMATLAIAKSRQSCFLPLVRAGLFHHMRRRLVFHWGSTKKSVLVRTTLRSHPRQTETRLWRSLISVVYGASTVSSRKKCQAIDSKVPAPPSERTRPVRPIRPIAEPQSAGRVRRKKDEF